MRDIVHLKFEPHMSKKKSRLGAIEREVLEHLSTGDLLVGFLCSATSTRRMYKIARERAMHRYRTKNAIERLVQEGYIVQNGESLAISPTGKRILDTTIAAVRNSLEQRTWDGKWRIVAFDIPESLSVLRHRVRSILKRAGFMRLQNSVWVFPHDCVELSALIKEDARLRECVLYGVLEEIEGSARLKKLFGLRG